MSTLQNYVILIDGIEKTLKVTAVKKEPWSWIDKDTGKERQATRQVLTVVEEDGVKVNKFFSHFSEDLAGTIEFWFNSGILPQKRLHLRRLKLPGTYKYERWYTD